jgi:molecular chaperone GrpE
MSARKSQQDKTGPDTTDETVAEEIEVSGEAAALLAELKDELDKAVEARQRALADFANFQRRASQNEQQAVRGGEASVVRSMLGVLDHFDLALDQDKSQVTVEQLLGGVQIMRDEMVRALDRHGVERIAPVPGDEFDPNRHQAVLQQPAEGIAANHVVAVLQTGYTMGETVLRPAKVSVAPQDEDA